MSSTTDNRDAIGLYPEAILSAVDGGDDVTLSEAYFWSHSMAGHDLVDVPHDELPDADTLVGRTLTVRTEDGETVLDDKITTVGQTNGFGGMTTLSLGGDA